MLFKLNSKEITVNTYKKETTMKRHKKVLFEQIKEEQQSRRKKKPSAAYYFATDAVWNILKVVLVVVGSLVLSVIVTAINNGQAPDAAVLSFWVKMKEFFYSLFGRGMT